MAESCMHEEQQEHTEGTALLHTSTPQSEQSAPAYSSCSHAQRGVYAERMSRAAVCMCSLGHAWGRKKIHIRPCTYVTDCSNAGLLSSFCGVLGRKPLTDTAGPRSTTEAVTMHGPAVLHTALGCPCSYHHHFIMLSYMRAVDFLLAHSMQSLENPATTTHPAQLCCNVPSQSCSQEHTGHTACPQHHHGCESSF